MSCANPLLTTDSLPPFGAAQPEHVTPALDQLLAVAEQALEQAVDPSTPADFDALSRVLDVATERLDRAWGLVGPPHAVGATPPTRPAQKHKLGPVTAFHTRLGSDTRLQARYEALAADGRLAALSPARQQVVRHALRDFELSGATLTGEARSRFLALRERLSALEQQFAEHVMDATDAYALYVESFELDGVSEEVLQATAEAARADGRDGHKLTLQFPCYLPVMQEAHDRRLRERLYRAYVTRASELAESHEDARFDNTALMREIVQLRQEEAQLLGRDTYAHLSLEPKMADRPEQVEAFLLDLARRARPYAERDLADMRAHAAAHLNMADLQVWDHFYVSEHLRQSRYAFSEREVRSFFTEPQVLQGLFRIVETVFEVSIHADTAPTWHPDVRFYRVERNGTLLAHFYYDPYARTGKQSGAWMDVARARWLRPDGCGLQTPVAHLVCNFAPPLPGKPALLTHDDVITLFHEFGHGLHLMLTQVDELGVSGLSGVEWDAVELPSQFMENFCWEWSVVRRLTAHVDTGEPMPQALFDKMLEARNFQSGLQTLRQVEYALFDLRLHAHPGAENQIEALMDAVRAEVAVVQPPPWNRFQHSFSHIFEGAYAAGYYSYKWAEVLSADAWSAFEETEPLSRETGRRLRAEVFERGGSRSALENFIAFRGRAPQIDALLRHQGMA